MSETLLDQVYFGAGLISTTADIDGNGALDVCEHPATQISRVGSPANPDALKFGAIDGPRVGQTYAPFIEHTTFMPNSQLDILLVSLTTANIPLGTYGTLLGGPADTTLFASTGAPFAIPIPLNGALYGLQLTLQGASAEANAPLPGGGLRDRGVLHERNRHRGRSLESREVVRPRDALTTSSGASSPGAPLLVYSVVCKETPTTLH